MNTLRRTQFGNPILRETARQLTKSEVLAPKTQKLIKDMKHTLTSIRLGIGLAAPQVGESVALAVIVLQPTPHRMQIVPFEMVIINPEITQTFGRKKQLWEGCISSGPGTAGLFAMVPRYSKIKVKFMDSDGEWHHKQFEDLQAHVIQHETDHLNGVLFPDRVKDTKSYMTYAEYKKRQKKASKVQA
ncbi:MAG TPA: peptide deformylase [Candidatus Limnocylindrales bacterium]|nr:peptide deformylase [Candidatus Limnocylindrales bacterium]